MKRMHALCLMPSHTFYYKKLNEFGMDYDKDIFEKVKTEEKRKEMEAAKMSKLSCMSDVRGPSSMSDTIQPKESDTAYSTMSNTCNTVASENVLSSSSSTECNIQGSDNARNKIMQSLVRIQEEDSLEDTQSQQNKLLVFSSWKADDSLKSMKPSFTDASTGNIDQTLADNVNHDLTVPGKLQLSDKLYPSDTGRKFVLDNVDIHQTTHDMSEEHQNPDAHYCSLMCTENRVTGNYLSDDQPICNLKDLGIGKCVPSKLEHSQQHDNYVHLVSRVITSEVPCLNFLKDVALPHIPHIYSKEMREKTDTVSI